MPTGAVCVVPKSKPQIKRLLRSTLSIIMNDSSNDHRILIYFLFPIILPILHWFCVYHYGDSQFGKRTDSVLLSSAKLLPSPSAILFEFLKIETFIILDGRDETRLVRCLGSLFSIHSSSWILFSNKFSPTTLDGSWWWQRQDKTRQDKPLSHGRNIEINNRKSRVVYMIMIRQLHCGWRTDR